MKHSIILLLLIVLPLVSAERKGVVCLQDSTKLYGRITFVSDSSLTMKDPTTDSKGPRGAFGSSMMKEIPLWSIAYVEFNDEVHDSAYTLWNTAVVLTGIFAGGFIGANIAVNRAHDDGTMLYTLDDALLGFMVGAAAGGLTTYQISYPSTTVRKTLHPDIAVERQHLQFLFSTDRE